MIAITPDGGTVYVASQGGSGGLVTPVRVRAGAGKALTPVRVGQNPAAVAITPDGRVAYVISRDPRQLAVTPNGRTLLVGNFGPGNSRRRSLLSYPEPTLVA